MQLLSQLVAPQKKRPEDVVIDVKSGKVVQGDFGKWEKERKAKLAKQKKIITTANGWELDWNKKSDPTAEDWARLKAWDDQQGPNPKTRPFAKGAQPTTVQATDAEGNVRPSGLLGITDAVNFGNERLGQFAKNLFAPIKGGPHDIMGDYKDPSARIETGELVAAALAAPGEVVGEAGVVLDPNPETTLEQRGKAVLGMLVNGLGLSEARALMGGATLTKSMYSKLVQRFGAKEANRLKNEVAEIGVTFRPAKGAKPVEEAIPDFKPKKEAPEAPQTKTSTGEKDVGTPESDVQGIRHEDVDQLRADMGWEITARGQKPDEKLFKEAKKHSGKEAGIAQKILGDEKKTLTDSEGLALGSQLRALKQQMQEAKAANKVDDFDNLEAEARTIADALDESGSRQGRSFRARRFLARDFDSWEFNRGVEKAKIDGQDLSPKKEGYRQRVAAEVDASTATLKAERDKAVKDYELLLGATKSKSSRGPMSSTQRRNAALSSLRKLGVPVADDVSDVAGGMKSKQSGAINIPISSKEQAQLAAGVRSLVKTYGESGAKTWKDVLTRLQKDLPGIEEEQALFILSGNYKKAKLQADIARKKSYEFMRDVKRDAEFRLKPITEKAWSVATDVLNTTQRSFQTTLDNSMALIQGKNVLTWKPGTWLKAVGTSLRAFVTKSPIEFARKEMGHIENHPLYSRAVKAKLALSDIDGPFSKQEEFFAGSLENHVPGLANSKAAATILMNKMRFDLFRKLAKNAPKDAPAAYYEDIARQINVATGKGEGKLAEMMGSKEAGMAVYAGRYYVSKWQHMTLNPLRKASTKQGQKEALKMYGTQLAGYSSLIGAAQLFGFEVDTDPRSANFGMATAKDGSYSFDVFRQASEPVRVGMQLLYGRTSKKGNYTDPGDYGSYGIGDYVESKLSALGKTAKMFFTGTTYDEEKGSSRTATANDFWQSYIPLSVKEMMKAGDLRKAPASFMGAGIDKPIAKDVKNPPPPLQAWPPPGLKRMGG